MRYLAIIVVIISHVYGKYDANWKSIRSRPSPAWYDEAKIGIMIHWGVYSVPSFGLSKFSSEWIWPFMNQNNGDINKFIGRNYPPKTTYQDFASMFTGDFFDADQWAKLFYDSGAKYVVFTSKHHDGFTMFPSKRSQNWNSVDIGPKRDVVKELAKSVRSQNLIYGLYYSLIEWYNPLYRDDKSSYFVSQKYVDGKMFPEIKQLINDYKPAVLWADGDWDTFDSYFRSKEIIAWLYDTSPVKDWIVVNDRWGIGTKGRYGDFFNMEDRYNPGKYKPHKWENVMSLDKVSWGYRRNMCIGDVLTYEELIYQVVSTVSCGGNILINVGPTKDGIIPLIFQERLLALGEWLIINGEAIYGTTAWEHQNDVLNKQVWYTCAEEKRNTAANITRKATTKKPKATTKAPGKKSKTSNTHVCKDGAKNAAAAIFATVLSWPKENVLKVSDLSDVMGKNVKKVQLLGYNGTLKWTSKEGVVTIYFPHRISKGAIPAWSVKISLK